MVNDKIILYYQTLIGLEKIYNDKNNYVTNIHLSSFHFVVLIKIIILIFI